MYTEKSPPEWLPLCPAIQGGRIRRIPGTIDGYICVFDRYFPVFALAVEQAPQAEPVRDLVRAATRGLAGWCRELAAIVAEIDRTVLRLALPASDSSSSSGTMREPVCEHARAALRMEGIRKTADRFEQADEPLRRG
jgi:hypothetical protein